MTGLTPLHHPLADEPDSQLWAQFRTEFLPTLVADRSTYDEPIGPASGTPRSRRCAYLYGTGDAPQLNVRGPRLDYVSPVAFEDWRRECGGRTRADRRMSGGTSGSDDGDGDGPGAGADPRDFEAVYADKADALHAYAASLLRGSDLVDHSEDVVQEAIIGLWRGSRRPARCRVAGSR